MIFSWLTENYIEVLGCITGLIYLFFSIRQIIWLWPLGIVTSFLYIFVFFDSKFYAGMALQGYYLLISIYGWYYWLKGEKNSGGTKIPVKKSNLKEWTVFILITSILSIVIGYGLDQYTDSPLPYWDAFTTSGSIVATWMLARKYLENWLFWIIVDFVSMGTYIYKELYPTVFLFFVYTTMAGIGFINWKKDYKKSKKSDYNSSDGT
jgi:nicotinamide mononucleotide transporter